MKVIVVLLPILLFVSACGRGGGELFGRRTKEGAAYSERDSQSVEQKQAPEPKSAEAPSPSSAKTSADGEPISEDSIAGQLASLAEKPAVEPGRKEERKRIYSGYGKLMVDDLEEQKREISDLVEQNGGYVESVYEKAIVVRVPAGQFFDLFRKILSFGEMLHKSVETFDVTEYFQDLSTRLDVAKKTRQRLYTLLERTKDVEERLKILREIRRLTEEIERIGLTLTLLERQIAFSRITVDLVPRLSQESETRDQIPFPWIARLEPLSPTLNAVKGRIQFQLSDEFAVFEKTKDYRAESADGTRVRVGTTPNTPRGDALFWQKALSFHLGKYYRTAENRDLGSIRSVLFSSKDRKPFHYLVGVVDRGDFLYVVEVFSPDTG
ncbi:MAG TPA: DUF4349 domain-containing protein, partial [Spirochaetia bacterium]|nr:DUF4349 domain-containing protein [Spirochaetia bacterium]